VYERDMEIRIDELTSHGGGGYRSAWAEEKEKVELRRIDFHRSGSMSAYEF
jgi:hypothetical protein